MAFARSDKNDMWVPLLEKGWAKLHTSYAGTEGGIPSFAASHLTGVPTISIKHEKRKDRDDLWELLKEVQRRKFTIMGSSLGAGEIENDDGIVSGHSYSIVGIHEFKYQGSYERLLKLRNPWGSGGWKGKWSKTCPNWTPELCQQLG